MADMSTTAAKRITREFAELQKTPIEGIKIQLASESDMHTWNVYMDGPKGSAYEGGLFHLHLLLPPDYPFRPPTLSFRTKIYHPNVSNDDKGLMCLGMLRPDEWKPSERIERVLKFARGLLSEPLPDDAVEQGIAKEFKEDRKGFLKTARGWTKQHAKK